MNKPLAATLASGAGALGLVMLVGAEGITVHDARSLLSPTLQRSEVVGFVAGRSAAGVNPTMAGITGTFQLLWIYYGLLIASRPVIAWNMLGALLNLVTVMAYRRFANQVHSAQPTP